MIYWPAKASAEKEDFAFDFTPVLQEGENIASRIVTATGVTKDSDSAAGGIVTVWLSGGTLGTSATVTCTITTDSSPARVYSEIAVLLIGEEPVSLAQAKEYLRVFHDEEDAKIAGMITRARKWVEDYTGTLLVRQQITERYLPQYGAIRLFKGPLVSVDSIDYVDGSGVSRTYVPLYWAGTPSILPAAGEAWPSLGVNQKFSVTYTAGLTPDQIDPRLIGAVNALVEGEYSDGFAYPQRATDAAERCCGQLRPAIV